MGRITDKINEIELYLEELYEILPAEFEDYKDNLEMLKFHHSIEWWSKDHSSDRWNLACSRTSMMLCIMPLVY